MKFYQSYIHKEVHQKYQFNRANMILNINLYILGVYFIDF